MVRAAGQETIGDIAFVVTFVVVAAVVITVEIFSQKVPVDK